MNELLVQSIDEYRSLSFALEQLFFWSDFDLMLRTFSNAFEKNLPTNNMFHFFRSALI